MRGLRELAADADELLRDSNRYLTEFGSIEPEVLAAKIRAWRNEYAIAKSQERNPAP